jgi:hypothetical protein
MASAPLKHFREESQISDVFSRPTKVPRIGGNGMDESRAIVLDDSDDDSEVTLVDQKPLGNPKVTEVIDDFQSIYVRPWFLAIFERNLSISIFVWTH